jgi:hypothetical protein
MLLFLRQAISWQMSGVAGRVPMPAISREWITFLEEDLGGVCW